MKILTSVDNFVVKNWEDVKNKFIFLKKLNYLIFFINSGDFHIMDIIIENNNIEFLSSRGNIIYVKNETSLKFNSLNNCPNDSIIVIKFKNLDFLKKINLHKFDVSLIARGFLHDDDVILMKLIRIKK